MTPNPPHSSQRASDSAFTSKLALGCGLAIVLLLAAVFVRNRDALLNGTPKPEPSTPVAEMAPPPPPPAGDVTTPAEADRLLVMAEDQIKRGQYDAAIAQLNRIPADRRNAQYDDLRGQAIRGRNRELLGQARLNFRSTQASDLSRAIRQVSQIQPQEPFYEEAQADIDRWSGMILDIAQGRAKRGDFGGAIAAAKLIPPDREAAYDEAQTAIASWEALVRQQKTNRDILQEAQRQVQAGQASSYNRAIDLASQIEAGQPGYAAARAQIDQWSQAILKLAEARASENQLGSAIETALLVPPNTAAYPAAEQAIAIWKRRLGG
jgi:hypothetical protein